MKVTAGTVGLSAEQANATSLAILSGYWVGDLVLSSLFNIFLASIFIAPSIEKATDASILIRILFSYIVSLDALHSINIFGLETLTGNDNDIDLTTVPEWQYIPMFVLTLSLNGLF